MIPSHDLLDGFVRKWVPALTLRRRWRWPPAESTAFPACATSCSSKRMTANGADEYWATRPIDSRFSASASHQSHRLKNREELVARVAQLRRELKGKEPVRPNYWLGLRVVPNRIEFWVQAPFRLHHRELFLRRAGQWHKTLLQP